ncbi:hypothetical protein QFC22_001278 [Naganishia vaughanmartiniae]|uniref:Uncharacterized protein n=1 Tax=Naganishia vaughanmartiniae TaxID=1424756 RepID=A0ACC2XGY4_9TREE|nr:hypothetical protein QFC22_001278 [Naganishia vaughanmartiniae]
MTTNASDPLSTQALLKDLDEVSKEIPNIIQYLGSAMGTLKDIDPARKDVWARNLTGLSGQYYGRLDVVRMLHERGSSPYAIRPPLPTQPLPKAFKIAKSPFIEAGNAREDDHFGFKKEADAKSTSTGISVGNTAGVGTAEQETEKDNLSVYARRLEVTILQELQQALQEMEGEGTSAAGSPVANDTESQKAEDEDHAMVTNVADERANV